VWKQETGVLQQRILELESKLPTSESPMSKTSTTRQGTPFRSPSTEEAAVPAPWDKEILSPYRSEGRPQRSTDRGRPKRPPPTSLGRFRVVADNIMLHACHAMAGVFGIAGSIADGADRCFHSLQLYLAPRRPMFGLKRPQQEVDPPSDLITVTVIQITMTTMINHDATV
jgi:hypothetical protein